MKTTSTVKLSAVGTIIDGKVMNVTNETLGHALKVHLGLLKAK